MQGLNTTICVLRKNYCQQAVFVDIVDHVSGSIDVSQCNNLRKIGLRQNNDLTCEHIILSTNQDRGGHSELDQYSMYSG